MAALNELPEPSMESISMETNVIIMENKNNDNDTDKEMIDSNSTNPNEMPPLTIVLTHWEQKLFDLLCVVAEEYNNFSNTAEGSGAHKVQFRIAGGWVRDKLLGKPSHDIDVAIETVNQCETVDEGDGSNSTIISGVQAAEWVQRRVQQDHPNASSSSRIAVIAANPDQSKHLETAKMKLGAEYGQLEVDFVPLRGAEVYTEDSRIPEFTSASPYQDALRRDFTVNALFFNVHTRQIEDWTNRGVPDLLNSQPQERQWVTPVDPMITFRDDPLRLLRAIRFGVRYPQLRIHDDIAQAAQQPTIQDLLRVKVSRERVGTEVDGMLTASPFRALQIIADWQIGPAVFLYDNPTSSSIDKDKPDLWRQARESLGTMGTVLESYHVFAKDSTIPTTPHPKYTPLVAYLLPFAQCRADLEAQRESSASKKKAPLNRVVHDMLRDGLKLNNADLQLCLTMVNFIYEATDVLNQDPMPTRLQTGLWIRQVKGLWVSSLLLAACRCIRIKRDETEGMANDDDEEAVMQRLQKVYHTIVHDHRLDRCWTQKPYWNGKQLIQGLGLKKGGPVVGRYAQLQTEFMLQYPEADADACMAYLKQQQAAMGATADNTNGKHENSSCKRVKTT